VLLVDFLQQGEKTLQEINKSSIDTFMKELKSFMILPEKDPDELNRLVAESAYYYGVTGQMLAQLKALKLAYNRKLEVKQAQVAKVNRLKVTTSTKKDFELKCALDTEYQEVLEKQHKEKIEELRGENVAIEWGSQIRSYVLHPYKMVKDHRTGQETSQAENVLEGDLDEFIEAGLQLR